MSLVLNLGTVDHKGFGEAEEKTRSPFHDLSRTRCPLSSGPDICYSSPFKDDKMTRIVLEKKYSKERPQFSVHVKKQRPKHKKHKELVEQMVRAEHLMECEDLKTQRGIEVMHQVIIVAKQQRRDKNMRIAKEQNINELFKLIPNRTMNHL